jgi:RHS repeat-associated protein
VLVRNEYEPYGQLLNHTITDAVGYTGHVQDGLTGLTYMQQRYYDPMIGRFLSVDPVTAYDQPLVAFNRYDYAANNPYRFTDPDGRFIDEAVDAGFFIYDAGRFLGAVAAYGVGKATGNEALASEGAAGMRETGGAVAMDVTAAAIPGVAAPMIKGAEHGVETIRSADKAADTAKSLKQQAGELVEANGGKNRVEIRSPSQMHQTDLAGKSHGGVETPHTKVSQRNTNAPNQPAYNTKSSQPVSSTQQDIRNARNYLERKDR